MDYSDDEDEVEDKISDLNAIPNFFQIPKPVNLFKPPLPPGSSTSENPLLKKYAPLDWKTAFPTTYNICNNTLPIYISGDNGPNLICLHGAGHSGLSFAPLALVNKNYRIISFDFRGHGFNTQTPSNDLSEKTLINDTIAVLNHVHEKYPEENLVLIGHSMGGSIATKTCCTILREEEKMTINETKNGSDLIISLEGRLDTMTAPELEEALNAALTDVTELTFDLEKLEYISSAGLRVLLSAQKTMNRQGSMKVVHVNEIIMEIFEVTGFADILTIE